MAMADAKQVKIADGGAHRAHDTQCDADNSKTRTSLIILAEEKIGALADILDFIRNRKISLSHVESRRSRRLPGHYEFFVDIPSDEATVNEMVPQLTEICTSVHVLTSSNVENNQWFPKRLSDLDRFSARVLEYGEELDADHPGFNDTEYRKRRMAITANARNYKMGEKIPTVAYTPMEIETWGNVYGRLISLYPTHACKEYRATFPLLQQYCGYCAEHIPQLQGISDFLHGQTGFRLRPVAGLLSSRNFLNGLAFRVFHSTQYIRHHSQPQYTPEPDVCHEVLGHVPLFADYEFAEFSQEIGLLSLGVSDDDIVKLATCYWFTVEFGLCKEGNGIRAYGAGLLSSASELQYCLTNKPEKRPFDPKMTAVAKYPITEHQPVYYVAENFEDAKQKLRDFGKSLARPFAVRYNPYTESIEILSDRGHVNRLAYSIKADMQTLVEALDRLDIEHDLAVN